MHKRLTLGLSQRPTNPPVAAALPAASAASALSFRASGSFTRYDMTNVSGGARIPAGDWVLGAWFNCPVSTGLSGTLMSFSPNTDYVSNNCFHVYYDKAEGVLSVSGRDAAGNTLGVEKFPKPTANTTPVGLSSGQYRIPPGTDVLFIVQKTGSLAQLWLMFPGHAPVKASECVTSMGAVSSYGFLGAGRDSNDFFKGNMRGLFKLSYTLTPSQMQQIANGTNPTSLGTPAADDYYFLLDTHGATLTSTINSITASRVFDNATNVTGVGYAAMTHPVFLDPPGPTWFNFQQVNGSATVTLSGTYIGTDGDIQIQFLDDSNNAFKGWQTIAAGATGGTWSGSITLPKGKRWIKAQMRKVIAGVPSTDVMTSVLPWGVGENLIISGQSLMQHMGSTANPYGTTTVTPNGYTSLQVADAPQITLSGGQQAAITGVASSGGLIELTLSGGHGRKTGDKIFVAGILGTTEANGGPWTVTVTSRTKLTLNGSTFANAYVSGGTLYFHTPSIKVLSETNGDTTADGHVIIANAISNACACNVTLSNQAIGGQSIARFNSISAAGVNDYGCTAALAAHSMKKVGTYLWLHGHADIGLSTYFSSGGSAGAWTGYGSLGTLKSFNETYFPNSDFRFGVAGFTSMGGTSSATAANVHEFRHGMKDWVDRKIVAGDTNCFFTGWYNDFQPQWENGLPGNAHLSPTLKGYLSQAARLGHATAYKLGGVANDARGPQITSASRAGAVITLTTTHNGGTLLKTLRTGARPSGFEVASDTAFTSKLTISDVTITGANTISITLASDPGATVYVRYQYGYVGDYTASTYFTPRITGVADNGSGLIRVTCATAGLTPASSQKANTGHLMQTGDWGSFEGIAGATQANGIWQVTRISATQVDLIGSSSSGLGAFTAGSNLWQSSATPAIAIELATPIYDDRTIGEVDTNGAPLQPTYTYLVAA